MIRKLISLLFIVILLSGSVQALDKAHDFQVKDVNTENEYRLSNFTGKVVLLDFMYINCPGCERLEPALRELWPEYNGSAVFMSLDIVEGDSNEQLRAQDYPWIAGKVSQSVFLDYGGGTEIPMVVIIDKEGYVVFHHEGAMSAQELRSALNSALSGNANRIDIQTMSIYALAFFAGIASFFSPCSFPMLPGYMAYYFGIGKKETGYKKAMLGGTAAALGIIAIYVVAGGLLLYSASLIAPYIPMLGMVVGALLVVLGLLMFTPLQYDILLRPFRPITRVIKDRERGREHGFAAKLFGYGVAYGGAATGCTAPVFLAVVIGAMAISMTAGITAILIYSLSAGALMVAVTVLMAAVERKAVDFLKRHTEKIKAVSAAILILVGAYLIWYHLA